MKEEFYISLIGEAFDGYTEFEWGNETIYYKHINIRDQRYLHKYYEKYKKIALDKGLETEEDRIAYVLREEIWGQDDDARIHGLEFEVSNLKKSIKNMFLPSQQKATEEAIEEKNKELADLKSKRSEVIGKTAEDYATQRSGDEILRFLLFKNKELTEQLYTEEEFGNLEVWQVAKLVQLQGGVGEKLTDIRIQEAVLRPFFSLYLSICEDVGNFYRKPITELTIYQLRVALFGRMFSNIFQFTDDIPDDIRQDPERLIAYSDSQRNRDESRSKSGIREDADVSMVFGATKEDVEYLGADDNQTSLADEAKKHGGKLNMEQMMRLAGHDV